MIIYVHAHNVWDRNRTFGRHEFLPAVEHIVVRHDASMTEVADSIIGTARNRRSIWLLIFNAHGSPGRVCIGAGLDAFSVYDLGPVRPYMTAGGRGVEIHSCYAAGVATPFAELRCDPYQGDTPVPVQGIEFLRRLSNVLQCPVRASDEPQVGYQEVDWGFVRFPNPASDSYGRFEGESVVLVHPDGSYQVNPL